MKNYLIAALFISALISGCKSNDPASSNNNNNTLSGTWMLNYYGANDTLIASLNINGSNNVLSGSGSAKYSQTINSIYRSAETSGTLTGAYNDTSVTASFTNFTFNGIKLGSNYNGTATLIYYFSPTPDTLIIQNAAFVKK